MLKHGSISQNRNIINTVLSIAQPVAKANFCEVVDTEYQREGTDWVLRVIIDRDPPVDHDLCSLISETLSSALDSVDLIKTAYILEVSSPGLERALKKKEDFLKYIGSEIMVSLFMPLEGSRQHQGILLDCSEEEILLSVQELSVTTKKPVQNTKKGLSKNKTGGATRTISIPRIHIAKANLVIDFSDLL